MAKEKPATKICKHCATEIPYGAKVCPNCRKKVSGGIFKWILIAIVAIGVLGAAFGGGGDKEEQESPAAQTQEQSEDKDAAKETAAKKKSAKKKITYTTYDCTELFDDLNNNALKAEKTHQDEYVKVEGYLGTVDSDGKYIGLGAAEDNYDYMFQEIHCDIKTDNQLETIMNMKKGDRITVKGKITSIGELLGYNLDIIEIK